MFLLALAVSSTIAGAPACASNAVPDKGSRFTVPGFKGVELYSWRGEGGGFRYSLHWGTNRAKEELEIKFPSCVLGDIAAVKRALARLAPGESVAWSVGSKEKMSLAYPPPDIVNSLVKYSKVFDINLSIDGAGGSPK